MTTLASPKVGLKLTPVPKPVLYAGIAGELLANTGMRDAEQINAIQRAVSEGTIEKVIIVATDRDGRVDKFTLTMKAFAASDTVKLHIESGKSYLEALDVSLAAAVQYASDVIKRRRLATTFFVDWSPRAKANPAIIRDAINRLNLKIDFNAAPPPDATADFGFEEQPAPPPASSQRFSQTVNTYNGWPPLRDGHTPKQVLSISPAKDNGVTFSHETARRKR